VGDSCEKNIRTRTFYASATASAAYNDAYDLCRNQGREVSEEIRQIYAEGNNERVPCGLLPTWRPDVNLEAWAERPPSYSAPPSYSDVISCSPSRGAPLGQRHIAWPY